MFPREKEGTTTLYCFSPIVTLITFGIEIVLAAYVIIRYRLTLFGRLSALLLVLLGTFQLSEYAVCTSSCQQAWTRVAFASITFMPAIGLHLIGLLTGRTRWIWLGYLAASCFMAVIVFHPATFFGVECPGRFVIFHTGTWFGDAFGLYYVSAVLIGLTLMGQAIEDGHRNREALIWLVVGYLSFMAPTFVLYVFAPTTRMGLASVMCGFAIFLACILVGKILPLTQKGLKN